MLEFIIVGIITMAALGLYVGVMVLKKKRDASQTITFACEHCGEKNCDCYPHDSRR